MPTNSSIQFFKDYPDLKTALVDLGVSRSQLKKKLSAAQRNLVVKKSQIYKIPIDLLNLGLINPKYSGDHIQILKEDENFIAIYKPHNIHCYPQAYDESDNILSYFRSIKRFDVINVFKDNNDRGLLYRLDYATSGVVFLVKNTAIDILSLRENAIKKKVYCAIVSGDCELSGKYNGIYQAKESKGRKIAYTETCKKQELQLKITGQMGELEVLKSYYDAAHNCSLVFINLQTGLRHQIRSFLSHKGHPILGDGLYGGDAGKSVLHLHAVNYRLQSADFSFEAFCKPLFLKNFLDLHRHFQVFCDQIGIS